MGNFFYNYANLFRALLLAILDPRSLHLLAMSASLVALSAAFYVFAEGWDFIDAIYFSVVTMATVGYGDFVPVTTAGKIFTIFFTICGIGIFVATVSTIASSFIANFKVRK